MAHFLHPRFIIRHIFYILLIFISTALHSTTCASSSSSSSPSSSSSASPSPAEPLTSAFSLLPTAVSNSLFKCPEKFGYYSDSTDCSKYFVCVFGEPLHETCTGGLFFHAELQTCDWPRNVPCADGLKRSASVASSESDTGRDGNSNSAISVFDEVDDSPDHEHGDSKKHQQSVTRSPVDYDLIADKLRHEVNFGHSNNSSHLHKTETNERTNSSNSFNNNYPDHYTNHGLHQPSYVKNKDELKQHQHHHGNSKNNDMNLPIGSGQNVGGYGSRDEERSFISHPLNWRTESSVTSSPRTSVSRTPQFSLPTLPLAPPRPPGTVRPIISDPHHNKIVIDNDDPQPPTYESEAIPPLVDSKGGIHFSDGPGGTYGLSQQIPGILSNNNNNNHHHHQLNSNSNNNNHNNNNEQHQSHSLQKSIQLPTLSLFTIKPISLRDKERIASSLTSLLVSGKSGNENSSLDKHRREPISRSRPKQEQHIYSPLISPGSNSNKYIPVIAPEPLYPSSYGPKSTSSSSSSSPSSSLNDDIAPAPVSFFNDQPHRSIGNKATRTTPVSFSPNKFSSVTSPPVPKLPPPPPLINTPEAGRDVEIEHLRSQASYAVQPPRSYISPVALSIDSMKRPSSLQRNDSSFVQSLPFADLEDGSVDEKRSGLRLGFKEAPAASIVMIPVKVPSGSRTGIGRVKVIPRHFNGNNNNNNNNNNKDTASSNSFANNHMSVYFDDEEPTYDIDARWNKPQTSYPPTPFTPSTTSTSTSTSTTTTSTSTTSTTTAPSILPGKLDSVYGNKKNADEYERSKSPYGHLKYDLDTHIDDIPDEYDDEYRYTSRIPYRTSSPSTVPPKSSYAPTESPVTTSSPPVLTDYSPFFLGHDSHSINRSTTVQPFGRITSPAPVTPKTMKSYKRKSTTTTTTSTTPSPTTTTPTPVTTLGNGKFKNTSFIITSPTARSLSNRSTTISIVRQLSAKRSRPTNKRLIVKYRTTLAPKLPSRPESVNPTPIPLTSASKCDPKKCQLPDCNCGGTTIPGDLRHDQVPQIVMVTFDDAINDLNWEIYEEIFHSGRKNPNGCPPLGTFYVSHEWTDYGQVQSLYSRGHEIASHGITHSFGEKFSKGQWLKEIQGQREILHMYGGVKLEDIRGMRAPFLQVGGNRMFEMLYEANFTYDSSMPVFDNKPPFYPYTLDYSLNHECMITPCPSKSFPGLWEVGMVMWEDLNGGRCSMGDACSNPSDEDGVFTMLLKNFKRHYETNRAPFGLFYHSAWFNTVHHRKGFMRFLDEIMSYGDVYMTTNWQMIQWMRNPTPLNKLSSFEPWKCDAKKLREERPEPCHHPSVCNLRHESGSRFMKTCQPCPSTYPWVGNTGFGKQMS